MISEKLVFKIFPTKLSYIDKFYYRYDNRKSKWFSMLVAIDDVTLNGTHYFLVESFKPITKIINPSEEN